MAVFMMFTCFLTNVTNIGINMMQENFNLKHIADAPLDRPDPQSTCDKERLRGLRKRCKKLRLRVTQRSVL